jgi:hypothetical protein
MTCLDSTGPTVTRSPAWDCVSVAYCTRADRALLQRERRIVLLRYIEELTQDEIAARTRISQTHVSRWCGARSSVCAASSSTPSAADPMCSWPWQARGTPRGLRNRTRS